MKRMNFIRLAFVAMLMLTASTAWAQYVKVTNGKRVTWVAIKGNVDGTKFVVDGSWQAAIDASTVGKLNLNEVWSESGGTGTHYEVTAIGPFAFYRCSSLTSIQMPNSVTSIGMFAFESCGGLTSINISNQVESIEQFSFTNCKKLSSIIIPNSVKSIGLTAFAWCEGLTSLTLSSNLEFIDEGAFRGCSGLTSLTIPSSVTRIGLNAFEECSGLTSIVVEAGNKDYDSRRNCNAIIETNANTLILGCMNTTIPNSVTKIGDNAFYGCKGLTSIDIPSSVTSIGSKAFYDCRNLSTINSFVENVFVTGTDAFKNCDNATLYVPYGLASAYRSTADWNRINTIEEASFIALAMSCNNKGKVVVNGGVQFTNNMGEVSVFNGMENTFVFTPNENCHLEQVLIDGVDVTNSVQNNQLTTMIDENSKMIVMFSKSSGDVNGDGAVDISDVVALVNIILGQ